MSRPAPLRSLIYRERGVCVGVRGCVGVRSGERRGPLGSRGKLPKFSNFQPAIPLNSAGKAPLASSPRRKPELCAAPEPERPDAVPAVSKVGGSQLKKARARGEKVLPSPREKRVPGPAGRQAGALASEQARRRPGGGPSTPSRAAFKQKTSPPETPYPPACRPLPTPARRENPASPPSPAPYPAARLTSVKPPALERGKRGAG